MKCLNAKAVEDLIIQNTIYLSFFHEYAGNVLIISITSLFLVSHVF